jgi:hypothetical protein
MFSPTTINNHRYRDIESRVQDCDIHELNDLMLDHARKKD